MLSRRMTTQKLALLARSLGLMLLLAASGYLGHAWALRKVVPGVTPVVIAEADLGFRARLDTGAQISSINAINLQVVGGEGRPTRRDIGRKIRFTLVNHAGKQASAEAEIAGIHSIRTADCREFRYHVYLTVVRGGERHRVLMNLNDRSASAEKLLLGRNWLDTGYLVDAMDES